MKKLFYLFILSLLFTGAYAQAPQKMSYQSVIRNASGSLITNQAVGMQISVLQGSSSGSAVYVETQTSTTNNDGLSGLEIGAGTVVSGSFNSIDWSAGPYFIKTEIDPTGGTSYTITGTSELLSVPYALYSANGSTWTSNGNDITNSNSGNVGIKSISAPTSALQIGDYYNAEDTYVTVKTSGGNFFKAGVGLYHYNDSVGWLLESDETDASFAIKHRNGSIFNHPALTIDVNENVGIGTGNSPAAKLDVAGNVKITDGTEGQGKVLTSDANGLATWADPGSHVGFKANTTSGQSLPDATYTIVTFDDLEFDDASNYNISSNGFVAPSAGMYHFDMGIVVDGGAGGSQCYIDITVNGSFAGGTQADVAVGKLFPLSVSTNIHLNAGDVVQVLAFPYGTNNTVYFGAKQSFFSGYKVY